MNSHSEELALLQKLGFPVNPYNKEVNSLKEVWEIQQNLYEQKEKLNYPIDGLVVKVNNNQILEKTGVVGKTNRAWCAIKFAATEVSTKIVNIIWQVGRTGRVTPVAILEPVLLQGSTVKKATLHNYSEVIKKNLHQDDMIIIRKAGDIIPEVVNVLENLRTTNKVFQAVENCPSCKQKLGLSETKIDLVCTNVENCPAQILGRLSYFCQKNIGNIDGLSDKILDKFVKEYSIKDIPDIFNLPYDKIAKMEGFGLKSSQNLEKSIKKTQSEVADYKFLAGLSIEGLGPEVAKLIIQKIYSKKGENQDNKI